MKPLPLSLFTSLEFGSTKCLSQLWCCPALSSGSRWLGRRWDIESCPTHPLTWNLLLSPGLTKPYAEPPVPDWATQGERQCSLWYHVRAGLAVLAYLPRLTLPCCSELSWPSELLSDLADYSWTCSTPLGCYRSLPSGSALPHCHLLLPSPCWQGQQLSCLFPGTDYGLV